MSRRWAGLWAAPALCALPALFALSPTGCARSAISTEQARLATPAPPASSGPIASVVPPVVAPLAPSGPPAVDYRSSARAADGSGVPPDPLRDAIRGAVRELARRNGVREPELDARLDDAMNEFARALGPDDLPAPEAVDFLLAYYGLPDPPPHWLIERASLGADRDVAQRTAPSVLDTLRGMVAARLGVGIDRRAGELRIVVAVQEKDLELDPVPRRFPAGRPVPISGRLQPRFHDPALVVTSPAGTVRELPLRPVGTGGRFAGVMSCDAGAGRYQIEVSAASAGGPGVLANFPIYCGVRPPAAAPVPAGVLPVTTTTTEAESRLLALVNRDRAAAGLAPLAIDARLVEAARAHSRDMAEHDFVAHISPSTGSAVDRVARVGLAPALLLENVGRAYSAEDAEGGFMSSPGHRGNILDGRARLIGIGVAAGRETTGSVPLFVTQLMM